MTLDVAKGWNLKGGVFFLCSPEQLLFFKATDSLTQRWNCTQTGYSHPQDLSQYTSAATVFESQRVSFVCMCVRVSSRVVSRFRRPVLIIRQKSTVAFIVFTWRRVSKNSFLFRNSLAFKRLGNRPVGHEALKVFSPSEVVCFISVASSSQAC